MPQARVREFSASTRVSDMPQARTREFSARTRVSDRSDKFPIELVAQSGKIFT